MVFFEFHRRAHSRKACLNEVYPVKPIGLFCLTEAEIPTCGAAGNFNYFF